MPFQKRITPPKKTDPAEMYASYNEPTVDEFGKPMLLLIQVDNIRIYQNDIEYQINHLTREWGLDEPSQLKSGQWSSIMRNIGKNIFGKSKVLYAVRAFITDEGENFNKFNNTINPDVLDELCDYYIDLCNRYNKLISITDFSKFIDIPIATIYNYDNMILYDYDFSHKVNGILNKLREERENCLKFKLFDNGNAMGQICIGNTEYGWHDVSQKVEAKPLERGRPRKLPRLDNMEDNGN